jgi:surface carbohydrate biosynthesis protein
MDNYVNFYTISKKYPGVKTLFVQNGMRAYQSDVFDILTTLDSETTKNLFVDYMMVFGTGIGKNIPNLLVAKP